MLPRLQPLWWNTRVAVCHGSGAFDRQKCRNDAWQGSVKSMSAKSATWRTFCVLTRSAFSSRLYCLMKPSDFLTVICDNSALLWLNKFWSNVYMGCVVVQNFCEYIFVQLVSEVFWSSEYLQYYVRVMLLFKTINLPLVTRDIKTWHKSIHNRKINYWTLFSRTVFT